MSLFKTVTLPNGLTVEFHDHSNRYFGDYWRVSIEASCRIPVESAFSDRSDPELERARNLLDRDVLYRRTLEKMGVSTAEVEAVTENLVDSFLEASATYLSDPSFAARLVRNQLDERKRGARPFLVRK